MTGSTCSKFSARAGSPSQAASGSGAMRGGCGSAAPGPRCATWSRAGMARTMLVSTTISLGPPIMMRCSILSRRTSTRRRRPSTAAASITASLGIRPRLVLAPSRLVANRRTSQAAAPISARTATNAKKNVSACIECPWPTRPSTSPGHVRRGILKAIHIGQSRRPRSALFLNSHGKKLPTVQVIDQESVEPKRLLSARPALPFAG